MKTITTARLTLRYIQALSRHNFLATALSALISAAALPVLIFHLGGDIVVRGVANGIYAAAALISSLWCFITVYRARYGPLQLSSTHQLSWLLIGCGLLTDGIGGAIYLYLQNVGKTPFPSIADLFFNLCAPLLIAGLTLMPTVTRLRLRMTLDALIIMFYLMTFAWVFVLAPLYFSEVRSFSSPSRLFELVVGLSYPGWDLTLIFAILLLIRRRTEVMLHRSLYLFGIGILCMTWADFAYTYTTVFTNTYQTGTAYIDPFWFIGSSLIGLAALYQYSSIARTTFKEEVASIKTPGSGATSQATQSLPSFAENAPPNLEPIQTATQRLRNSFIYLPLPLLLLLTLYSEFFESRPIMKESIGILIGITGALLLLRFYLSSREDRILLLDRERRRQEAERLRKVASQLTSITNMQRLREQVVKIATDELGFDAAMLLSSEENDRSHDPQPRLQIDTIAKGVVPQSWLALGDSVLYRTYLHGKETEISLGHRQDVPVQVREWQQQHRISTMFFFPIIYSGQLLGSFGVARRFPLSRQQRRERTGTLAYLDPTEKALLRTYTAEVATSLEHVRLYQEAQERESFAQAMVNIATRLNSAVVEPAEISQLICEEGALVLRADYTVLYVMGPKGQLVPLGDHIGYGNGHNAQHALQDWPIIQPHEYEAQALRSLQPTLLTINHTPVVLQDSGKMLITKSLPAPATAGRGTTSQRLPAVRSLVRRPVSLHEKLNRLFVRTAILAPLMAGGGAVGLLLYARSHAPGAGELRAFDSSDLPQAHEFGDQAGVAFANAQLYHHLRTAHSQLQELDRLKDQFMVTASHELRTPLTAVQGYIELMAQFDDTLPSEQRREFLQKAQRGCDELVLLLGNVMDASQIDIEGGVRSLVVKPVSVHEMVENVITLIEPQLTHEKREVRRQVSTHLQVYADPVRLRQILMNVSVNALKYSPPGTPIGFATRPIIDRDPYVIITISDRGKGITPQDQQQLFQRFVRLERDVNSPVRGTGLGLYISRRLVEAMGGKIWIESRGIPGEGSMFHIQLPMVY